MRRLKRSVSPHVLGGFLFVTVVVFLFRLPIFFGYRFIGNSDRWNHYLSFVKLYSENLTAGRFSAWSDHLVLGFDTLKFIVPTPLYALPAALGSRDVVRVFGYVAPSLLFATLFVTYWVIYQSCRDRLAATCGAAIYALSTFSLLKLSQNDATYVAVLFSPLMFYLVDSATRVNVVRRAGILGSLIALGIFFSPQKSSYLVIFLACYVIYLYTRGRRPPSLTLAIALTIGAAIALPRMLVVVGNTVNSTRATAKVAVESVGPSLALRFFDVNILGSDWREALDVNQVNLSEGNLLFASMFASLLLVSSILRGRYTRTIEVNGERRCLPYGFFIAFILLVFAVIHLPFAYHLFTRLYAGIPLIHTRFAIAALFPIALVSAFTVTRDQGWRLTPRRAVMMGFIVALVLILSHADLHHLWRALSPVVGARPARFIEVSHDVFVLSNEAIRLAVVGLAFAGLGAARLSGRLDSGSFRTSLAIIIIGQAILGGDQFLNGRPSRAYIMPFERHDLLMARPGDFSPPTLDQIDRLHRLLDDANYRSILICPGIVLVDCSTGLGLVWNLRLADGYLGGIPPRYAALPWTHDALGLRSIRFSAVPSDGTVSVWKLLSLLNVAQAIEVTPELYTNRHRAIPDNLRIVRNPSPYVYPRAYFAAQLQSVTRAEAVRAIAENFGPCFTNAADGCETVLRKKHPVDYVEAPISGHFDASGAPSHRFAGDHVEVQFPASPEPRFLVINEAYDPQWRAWSASRQLPVFPTNLTMRGVVVPAGATHVTMRYRGAVVGTFTYVVALAVPLLVACLSVRSRSGREGRDPGGITPAPALRAGH